MIPTVTPASTLATTIIKTPCVEEDIVRLQVSVNEPARVYMY
jgi:hypothetical protein